MVEKKEKNLKQFLFFGRLTLIQFMAIIGFISFALTVAYLPYA